MEAPKEGIGTESRSTKFPKMVKKRLEIVQYNTKQMEAPKEGIGTESR
jgi:hypothetical protein